MLLPVWIKLLRNRKGSIPNNLAKILGSGLIKYFLREKASFLLTAKSVFVPRTFPIFPPQYAGQLQQFDLLYLKIAHIFQYVIKYFLIGCTLDES